MAAAAHRILAVIGYLCGAVALFVLLAYAWNYWWMRPVLIVAFLFFGLWTWHRSWRNLRVQRKERQRRWGIRRRADTDDRANAGHK